MDTLRSPRKSKVRGCGTKIRSQKRPERTPKFEPETELEPEEFCNPQIKGERKRSSTSQVLRDPFKCTLGVGNSMSGYCCNF